MKCISHGDKSNGKAVRVKYYHCQAIYIQRVQNLRHNAHHCIQVGVL
jgi:hypothetical protein